MKTWALWFKTPQPLRTLFALFLASFVFAFVSGLAFRPQGDWPIIPLGIVATLIGLTLLLNINGAANAISNNMKTQRPMGVDFSQSFLASPTYARFFGAFFAVVGTFMAIGPLMQ